MGESDRIIGAGRFLRLRAKGSWEYCERATGTAVIAIVAVTPENELVLVEQFRPALGLNVIELPAGLVGDEDAAESNEEAAARELEEEAGYRPGRVEYLMEGPTSAGLADEQVAFYRAHDLVRTGDGGGAGNERITVHRVPMPEIDTWLKTHATDTCLIDPKVYAALYFLMRESR